MDHAADTAPANVEKVTPPAAHTPGPWWACFGDDQPVAYYPGIVMYVSSDPHITVVTGAEGDKSGHVCDRDEWEANARLIAAAPDLLEALSEARKMAWAFIRLGVDLPEFNPDEHCLIRKIDAAIAKARGIPPDP